MGYSAEQLSDLAEIRDVVHRYAWSLDTQDWAGLDTCFTDDAYCDYSSNPGGKKGPYSEIRGWLEHQLAAFVTMQHLMVNTLIDLDGDRATVKTMMVNPMGARTREGPPHVFYIGGRYDDEFVRTADGWRIKKRTETLLWFAGTLPPELIRA